MKTPGPWSQAPLPAKPIGRSQTPDEERQAIADYAAKMREHFAFMAAQQRERCVRLGIERYRWVSALPDSCSVAARNNGAVFRYANPPPEGHPCEGACDADWCRCFAAPIVLGF